MKVRKVVALVFAVCLLGFAQHEAPAQPPAPQAPPPAQAPRPAPVPQPPQLEAGPGPAEIDLYFQYTVCNKSSYLAFVAIASRVKPGSASWRNHGWYSIQRGQCRELGSYPQGVFYWYARDAKGGTWGNGDAPDERTCVNLNGAFDFTYSDAAGSCRPGYAVARFRKVNVTGPAWQTTLND